MAHSLPMTEPHDNINAGDGADFDVAVIGAGINGAGIARDAAGRGARVALIEMNDIASATSSASSKLIHGGIRYLEHYEFSLVREALSEREVLLSIAPHLIKPMGFVMPHVPHLRPAWMIRIGLALYDRIGGKRSLPASRAVDLARDPLGVGLKPELKKGYVYSDCFVDDARLVIGNVTDAVARGATFFSRHKLENAKPNGSGWTLKLSSGANESTIRARSIVNAAGPWVRDIVDRLDKATTANDVRLVKGSHIVVPRLYNGDHAYILQNDDRRVVFTIPYEKHYCAIGTTDTPFDGDPSKVEIDDEEIDYLTSVASKFMMYPVNRGDVVSTWSGVRPLFDDGQTNASKVTRDYTLERIDVDGAGPVISIYGGKVTTYRHLAEDLMGKISDVVPGEPWTSTEPLPGGEFVWRDRERHLQTAIARYDFLHRDTVRALFRRHGDRIEQVLSGVTSESQMGQHFGDTLYEVEVEWFIDREWACEPDDILWRRTRCGVHLGDRQQEHFAHWLRVRVGALPGAGEKSKNRM